jgi:hypothetical protein
MIVLARGGGFEGRELDLVTGLAFFCRNGDFPCRNGLKYLLWRIMFQGIPLVGYRYHPLLPVITPFRAVESP